MEKTIKMSLETAKELWRGEIKKRDEENLNCTPLAKWLLENFTKEELEGKKGFTFNDCYPIDGFYIHSIGDIRPAIYSSVSDNSKNVFKTEAQAKSALAFAQLSHIVAKYNEGKERDAITYKIRPSVKIGEQLEVADNIIFYHLMFYYISDAETSLEVNRQLWLDYWMIE